MSTRSNKCAVDIKSMFDFLKNTNEYSESYNEEINIPSNTVDNHDCENILNTNICEEVLAAVKQLKNNKAAGNNRVLNIFHQLFLCMNLAQLSWGSSEPVSRCRPSVRLSVRLSVIFFYFRLLLKKNWANFNQTWHKASLDEWDSNLFKDARAGRPCTSVLRKLRFCL